MTASEPPRRLCQTSVAITCLFWFRETVAMTRILRFFGSSSSWLWIASTPASRRFDQFGDRRPSFGPNAQAIPDYDGHQRKNKDDGGYRVDLRSDAPPQAPPDFQR